MKVLCSDLAQHLPIRARVAFVLAVAGKVLPALAKHGEALNAAAKALTDGWRWEEGENISALQLYENDDEALTLQGCLVKEKDALGAIMAATSAFYYMLWHAYGLDLNREDVLEGEIPGMRDVTVEVIDEVCDYAIQTSSCDEEWISSLMKRLSREFHTENPDDLGSVIPRQFFEQ